MASQGLNTQLRASLVVFLALALSPSVLAYCPAPWYDAMNNTFYTAPFGQGADSYQTCKDLEGGAHFMYNITDKVLISHFEYFPEEPYGWVAWGQSFSGKMYPSNVLIAYGAPENPDGFANVSAWHLSSRNPSEFKVISPSKMNITEGPAVEIRGNGTLFAIRSKIRMYDPTKPINLISAKGPAFNFTSKTFIKHISKPQVLGINLATEAEVAVTPMRFNPFLSMAPAPAPARAPGPAPGPASGPKGAPSPKGAPGPKGFMANGNGSAVPTAPASTSSTPAPNGALQSTVLTGFTLLYAAAAALLLV